ncbi:acyl-CoA dehydrogenase [Streptomyces inusitatus]|uniref:Acyl-CoA dehydrogenase n=1 Tax=Streptomyces inusitatus TaxID=68221 RepID=A0A918Q9T6_9ACTN|nr:acyl-CoA dehydrogenase family protein [Streptomyces inusitatus]GGZ35948.1 acyl-CoA dehydrogenase [Streptomyces inusitatus]
MTSTGTAVESVLEKIEKIVPRLRENGEASEERRWILDENIELLAAADVFRAATPSRFGGLGLSLAEQCRVLAEISRGCASTGWVSMVWISNAWVATLYPDRAQEEIFSDPSVRISGGFTPSGTLTPTEGGYLLNGSWRFNTGCRGADWNVAAALLELPDGSHEDLVAIVPMSEFTIADDWHTSGAVATGSSTSTAENVFVPEHRVVSFEHAALNSTPGRTDVSADGRDYGLFSFVMAECAAVFTGIAQGAYELFLDRLPGRSITYTSWSDQRQHPLTQIQVATAANKIAAAEGLANGWLKVLQERADAGEQPTIEEKTAVRGQAAYAIQLAKEAVEVLHNASGASVIQRSVPIQRLHRDSQALSLHALLLLSTNLETYGRALLGLDPETPLL